MLFTKDVASISFDDVKSFFDSRLREGLRIDYKADFPSDLAKIITAFANTTGGLILIGIRANTTTNEPEEIVGIQLRNGLEERVISIAMSNIKPVVYPEVKIVPFKSTPTLPENDKAVVVIRVPESDIAPHIHTANNEIWVRAHNECAHADLDTIEHLIEKRDKGLEAENAELTMMEDIISKVVPAFRTGDRASYYAICVMPAYPAKTIAFNRTVDDFLFGKISRLSRGSFSTVTPDQNRIEFRSIRGDDHTLRDFFSINNKGVLVNIRPLHLVEEKVSIDEVIKATSGILKATADIFEKYQLNSKMLINITLYGIHKKPLWLGTAVSDEDYRCQSITVETEEVHFVDEVRHEEGKILFSLYNQMLRSFGCSLESRVIEVRIAAAIR